MIVWVLNVTIAWGTGPSCALTPNPTQNSVQDNDSVLYVFHAHRSVLSLWLSSSSWCLCSYVRVPIVRVYESVVYFDRILRCKNTLISIN